MVQQAPREHNAKLAFCTFHNSAYLSGDEFPKSPCCDTEPLLTYDLEDFADAAAFINTFVEALGAGTQEELLQNITVLAGLVRDRVAGAADQPSQELSTAADSSLPASGQVEAPPAPDASVESSTAGGGDSLPPPPATPPPTPRAARQPTSPAKTRTRQPKPAAAAVAS